MSLSQSSRRHGLKWVAGASLAAAILLPVSYWRSMPSREQMWREIEAAAESQRWAEVETGLRRWLTQAPEDRAAWTMLGGLLFDQGRNDEALAALRRVRPADSGWA